MNETILAIEKLSTRISKIEKMLEQKGKSDDKSIKETKHEIPVKTLIWGESSKEKMTWEEAKKWCEEQGGRMPTRLELLQAYEDKVEGFKEDLYWSATESNSTFAYYVNFNYGGTYLFYKTFAYYVRVIKIK